MAKPQIPASPSSSSAPPRSVEDPTPVMIYRINFRLVLATIALLVLVLPTVYWMHGRQVEGNADQLKQRAEAAEASGEYNTALQLFSQYLNFRPNDWDVLLHSLRLRDGLATSPATLSRVMLGYEELLRRAPNHPDEAEIRQDLVALALLLGEDSLARHHLETLLEGQHLEMYRRAHPEKLPGWKFQLAQTQETAGRVRDAWEGYLDVLEWKPEEHTYYLPVAALFADRSGSLPHRPHGKKKEQEAAEPLTISEQIRALLPAKHERDFPAQKMAEDVLERMVENASRPAEALLARAKFHYAHQQLAQARRDVESSRALESGNPQLLYLSAELARTKARVARLSGPRANYFPALRLARQDAADGRRLAPHDPRFLLLQSRIEEEAREGLALFPAIAEKPDQPDIASQNGPDPFPEAQLRLLEKSEQIHREGLEIVSEALTALEMQKPLRASLRLQAHDPPPNRMQLSQMGNQLRWSLADTLISKHEFLRNVSGAESRFAESATSLSPTVGEHIDQLKKNGAPTALIEFLEARLLMVDQNWKDAAWELEQTRLRIAGQTALTQRVDRLLDQCYGQLGNPDQQLQVVIRALQENPNWLPAIFRLPVLYEKANRIEDALRAYERIQSVPEAALAMAKLRVRKELRKPSARRRWEEIHTLLDSISARSLEDPTEWPRLRAEVYRLEGEQLAQQEDEAPSQAKYLKAVAVLEESLQTDPQSAELWAARGLLELRLPFPKSRTPLERAHEAAAMVQQARHDLGDQLPLRLAAVQIAAFRPTSEALQELAALEKPDFSLSEQPAFLQGLIEAQAIVGARATDPKAKEAALGRIADYHQQIAALQPTEIAPQIALAELAIRRSDPEPIQTAWNRVKTIEGPSGPNGNYLEALKRKLALQVKLEQSSSPASGFLESAPVRKLSPKEQAEADAIRRLLHRAAKERPYWAALPRALGDLEALVGHFEMAVIHYEKAYELGDQDRNLITLMVDYYFKNQRPEQADTLLQKVALDAPVLLTGDLARLQWQVANQLGRFRESIGIASHLAAQSADYRDHVIEGRLRLSHGERGPRVLKPLERACELGSDEPGPWLALVDYYVRVNAPDEAKATIEEARRNIKNDPPYRLPLTLARCYEYLKDRTAAEDQYRQALKTVKPQSDEALTLQVLLADFYSRSPNTSPDIQQQDRQKANQILDQILEGTAEVPQYTRDWARRRKALVAATSGRYDDTQRALEFLAQGRNRSDLSPADLRVEMRILAARNRHQDRLALIRILETLREENDLKPPEQRLLARCYEQTDQWPLARKLYLEILRSEEDDRSTLARYTSSLMDHGELREAETQLAELKRLEPDSLTVLLLEATYDKAKGNLQEAVARIQAGVDHLDDVTTPEQAVTDLVLSGELEQAVAALETQARENGDRKALVALQDVRRLLSEGNPDQAAETLRRQIQTANFQLGIQQFQLRTAAQILEQWDQDPAAEAVLHRLLETSQRPDDALLLIECIARQGRIREALALCEPAWNTSPTEKVGNVCIGILRTGQATSAEVELAESQLRGQIQRHPDSLSLKATLADLRDFQGRYEEAVQIYQAILQKNPNHLIALNNLAWLLAMRGEQTELALPYLELAINYADKLVGPVPELLDTRAVIYLQLGRRRDAIRDLERAIAVSAEAKPLIFFHLTRAYFESGQRREAERTFLKARSLTAQDFHPLERPHYERIAEALSQEGGSGK